MPLNQGKLPPANERAWVLLKHTDLDVLRPARMPNNVHL